jgi:hypothetical protein
MKKPSFDEEKKMTFQERSKLREKAILENLKKATQDQKSKK